MGREPGTPVKFKSLPRELNSGELELLGKVAWDPRDAAFVQEFLNNGNKAEIRIKLLNSKTEYDIDRINRTLIQSNVMIRFRSDPLLHHRVEYPHCPMRFFAIVSEAGANAMRLAVGGVDLDVMRMDQSQLRAEVMRLRGELNKKSGG